MKISFCAYIKSIPDITHQSSMPAKPEFAFIGRSNVGKSSLINLLAGKKQLARISKEPGKTIYFNYYNINQTHYWVDLPGYGFAKTSMQERTRWKKAWADFLRNNLSLRYIFLLIDARIPLQQADIDMMQELTDHHQPWAIVFTKTEKVNKQSIERLIHSTQTMLSQFTTQKTPCFFTSSTQKIGRDELLNFIGLSLGLPT